MSYYFNFCTDEVKVECSECGEKFSGTPQEIHKILKSHEWTHENPGYALAAA